MVTNSRLSHLKVKKKKLNFFREVQSEFKKVSWTTKTELFTYTKIVLGSTLVFGFVIYFADLFIRNILHIINVIFRWIA
jgi:preprotein translocase subunit SecE